MTAVATLPPWEVSSWTTKGLVIVQVLDETLVSASESPADRPLAAVADVVIVTRSPWFAQAPTTRGSEAATTFGSEAAAGERAVSAASGVSRPTATVATTTIELRALCARPMRPPVCRRRRRARPERSTVEVRTTMVAHTVYVAGCRQPVTFRAALAPAAGGPSRGTSRRRILWPTDPTGSGDVLEDPRAR